MSEEVKDVAENEDDALLSDLENNPAPEEADTPEAPASPQAAAPVAAAPAAQVDVPEEEPVEAAAHAEVAPPVAPAPQKTPQQIGAEKTNDDLQYWQDREKGLIHPKTASELFHEKSTLGKLGTLFGLMISGAGSGLAHQPNALMEMMNKELDRDLEGQKASKENAMNYYRLQQSHDMNQAQIGKVNAETMYQTLLTAGIPADIALKTAQAANVQAEAALAPVKAQHMRAEMGLTGQQTTALGAKNKMLIESVNYFQDILNKLPDGPQKANGQNFINTTFKPAVMGEVQSNNERAGAATVLGEAAKNKETPAVDLPKMNAMIQLGKQFPEHPMAMNGSEASEANKEAAEVMDNRTIAKMYDDSFKKLDQAALAGRLNDQFRKAELSTLGAEIARATAGRFNANEAAAQASGMFPSATDWGGSRNEKYRKAMQYFQGQEAATPTLDRFKLKTPFPDYKYDGGKKKPKETSASAATTATDPKTGQKLILKGGQWVPEKAAANPSPSVGPRASSPPSGAARGLE